MNKTTFRFKQFEISDEYAGMKLGTDAVILGAWADFNQAKNILDIGTGCGILALMAAQKNPIANIDAVEIDELSCTSAKINFEKSAWQNRITLYNQSFQNFIKENKKIYDCIISNPPYFNNLLPSPDIQRNQSRHNQTLPFETLIYGAKKILTDNGKIHLIIPDVSFINLKNIIQQEQLYFQKHCIINTKMSEKKKRHLVTLNKTMTTCITETLIIRDNNGNYTEEYKNLTKDFYLNF